MSMATLHNYITQPDGVRTTKLIAILAERRIDRIRPSSPSGGSGHETPAVISASLREDGISEQTSSSQRYYNVYY